ncbi:hypothetical protein CFP56_025621 [Quercus suber]|uniref:Uncharacterized protein n=1 Tax=Quercus suber TaxID=58331 RepID=A0AAW0K2G5_QUESU
MCQLLRYLKLVDAEPEPVSSSIAIEKGIRTYPTTKGKLQNDSGFGLLSACPVHEDLSLEADEYNCGFDDDPYYKICVPTLSSSV